MPAKKKQAPKKKKKDVEKHEEQVDDISFESDEGDFVSEEGEEAVEKLLTKIKKLKKKLKDTESEKQEYLDGWQRSRAEYARLKQEGEKEKEEAKERARKGALLELLPVADSFDMAFRNQEAWNKVDENWRKGVEYIHQQLHSAFLRENIKVFDALGEEFDPSRHEPLETVSVDKKGDDHKVVEVIQKGYLVGENVLRPAKVKVGKYTK